MTENITPESGPEEKMLVRSERRVTFGDYEDAKFAIAKPAFPRSHDIKNALASLCHLLNQEELKARRNHKDMKRVWAEEKKELERQEQLKADAIWREKSSQAFEILQKHPDATPSDLAESLELTRYEISDIITDLVEEGKLRRRECRRLFDIVEFDRYGKEIYDVKPPES